MKIEDTISDQGLPVNTIAMLNRGIEILKSVNTNSALSFEDHSDKQEYKEALIQYKKLLWLINQQIYGQMGIIDMMVEYQKLTGEAESLIH